MRILLLGGTTEASALARSLATARLDCVFSYAGRTKTPANQPLPMRIGGFGGVDGLATYLRDTKITHVIDATHPFAHQMSANAISACAQMDIPLLSLERPEWSAGPQDDWTCVRDIEAAVDSLPEGARVFLAIGKQNLAPFARKKNHYLLRLVDQPTELPLPDCATIIARGPFYLDDDLALLRTHEITHVVAKNSGGAGAEAKLLAARALHLPVILITRPQLPDRQQVGTVKEALAWLHQARLGV
jgi:precorrin-6A/cobalt-precorrin-6A reductase